MKKITIAPTFAAPTTQMYIGQDLLQTDLLKRLCEKKRAVVIADETLKSYAESLHLPTLYVPQGEKAKNRAIKEQIEDQLFEGGYGRDTALIALGGGAICDLVGFIAATFLRGVDLILIPTTLLAMVDAAIGGKTAIDTPFGKNLIGAFYQASAVIADLATLKTLPEIEKLNGLAEVIKAGLIYDPLILENLEITEELIIKAAKVKIAIIEKDPLDKGLRASLNMGHTIAHALEKLSNYSLPHGQAVGIGTLTESYLSFVSGHLPKEAFEQIETIYLKLPFQKLPKNYCREALLKAFQNDKKKQAGEIRFVLLDTIGKAAPCGGAYCKAVSQEALHQALDYMERIYAH